MARTGRFSELRSLSADVQEEIDTRLNSGINAREVVQWLQNEVEVLTDGAGCGIAVGNSPGDRQLGSEALVGRSCEHRIGGLAHRGRKEAGQFDQG